MEFDLERYCERQSNRGELRWQITESNNGATILYYDATISLIEKEIETFAEFTILCGSKVRFFQYWSFLHFWLSER